MTEYEAFVHHVEMSYPDLPNMQAICIDNYKAAECGMSYGHYCNASEQERDRAKADRMGRPMVHSAFIKSTRRKRPLRQERNG